MADLDALHGELVKRDGLERVRPGDLEPLAARGIAHDHIRVRGARLAGRAVLVRAPRLSQWGLGAEENLAYQEACFARAEASGRTPALLGRIAPAPGLPMGALLVEEIRGRKARLPDDLPAIAECLASIHGLPLPPPEKRPPLRVHDDPVRATLEVIEGQAAYLDAAGLGPAARAQVEDELAWARRLAAEGTGGAQPMTLVGTDTHPGNFLIEEDGLIEEAGPVEEDGAGPRRAVFVDLEKALYGAPAIDLAHATLYTSTMWDPDCQAELDAGDVAGFIDDYLGRVDAALARCLRPWLMPMRRLTWLRTLTWCARWRVESRGGGAWSAARVEPEFRDHISRIVEDYFDIDTITAIRAEWAGSEAAAPLGRVRPA